MKLSISKAGAAVALAGALLVAAPVAAQADTQGYAPTGPNTITVTVTSDGPVTFDGFEEGTNVDLTLVGKGITGANLATANLPVTATSLTKTADSTGQVTAVVTLPASPSGTYTLSATGARADGSTGGGSTGGGASEGGSNALPATGMDASSMLGVWVGGGALVLAGGVVLVAAKTRRRNENA